MKLTVTSKGLLAKAELDGVDVSHSLTGLTVRYDVRDVPTAVLDVALLSGSALDADDVTVQVPEWTAGLLVRLGWTPPEGQPLPALDTEKGTDVR